MSTLVPLLSSDQVKRLPERAREVVEYRKTSCAVAYVHGQPDHNGHVGLRPTRRGRA